MLSGGRYHAAIESGQCNSFTREFEPAAYACIAGMIYPAQIFFKRNFEYGTKVRRAGRAAVLIVDNVYFRAFFCQK